MRRLLDSFETAVSPSYRIFGLVDTSVDTYSPHADRTKWLLSAPGMVYLQVPPQVLRASVRLESWSTAPPASDASWSGAEDVEVELPEGELALETIDGGQQEIPLVLPSSGLYRMRWQWIFNRERGRFTSPLAGIREPLPMPPGLEEKVSGTDQYCLIQIWRTAAG
ncbi:hypothetical protein OOK31_00540 [Streptomyces sp. NBC_00249]|uniref:hypothetical protein n=1 Tax=Streptomyces sp. NBC_00249 TaxID=2975690 RepID=UPI002255091A|nr:hypothetical protein [Streptomyces sp. NBC_00249]MCX5192387.1 hypothetical protein [Streptomyces sp. NBC_00249]